MVRERLPSRRDFIKTAAIVAAGTFLVSGVDTACSSWVLRDKHTPAASYPSREFSYGQLQIEGPIYEYMQGKNTRIYYRVSAGLRAADIPVAYVDAVYRSFPGKTPHLLLAPGIEGINWDNAEAKALLLADPHAYEALDRMRSSEVSTVREEDIDLELIPMEVDLSGLEGFGIEDYHLKVLHRCINHDGKGGRGYFIVENVRAWGNSIEHGRVHDVDLFMPFIREIRGSTAHAEVLAIKYKKEKRPGEY